MLRCEPIRDLPGPIGRPVVDDENAVLRGVERLAERGDHGLEILPLVVRREAQDRARHRRIIAGCPRRCPATASWRISSTSWPTSRRSSRRRRSRSSRIGAPRGGSGSRRCRSPSSRSTGRRRSFRESARPSRTRSSRSSRTARCTRSRSGEVSFPAGVVEFLRLPGVGPKTAARIWTQLGITSLDGLKTAAEAGRLRDLSGMGARSEEKILKALEAGVGDKTEERRLLATALPAVRRVVAELQEHPAAIAVSEAGKRPPPPRDGSRSRPHRDLERRDGAHRGVLQRRLGRGSRGARRDEGDSRRARRPSLRSTRRAGGVLRQRAPALHGLEGSQHRAAGGRPAPRAVDLGVRRHDRRDRRGRHARERGRALRVSRVPHAGARAARGDGRDLGGARRRAPRSRRGR